MVKIISDSTCDLSQELLEKYDVEIVPLHILLGDQEYEDGRSITPDEIYAWSDANGVTPKTSAAGINQMIEAYRPYVENGDEIIAFSISSDMSTTYNIINSYKDLLLLIKYYNVKMCQALNSSEHCI